MSGWTVRLTHQAAQDIENILHWTFERFGPLQMAAYADVINDEMHWLNGLICSTRAGVLN
jgi:plasmid stabilization system protein ParE